MTPKSERIGLTSIRWPHSLAYRYFTVIDCVSNIPEQRARERSGYASDSNGSTDHVVGRHADSDGQQSEKDPQRESDLLGKGLQILQSVHGPRRVHGHPLGRGGGPDGPSLPGPFFGFCDSSSTWWNFSRNACSLANISWVSSISTVPCLARVASRSWEFFR